MRILIVAKKQTEQYYIDSILKVAKENNLNIEFKKFTDFKNAKSNFCYTCWDCKSTVLSCRIDNFITRKKCQHCGIVKYQNGTSVPKTESQYKHACLVRIKNENKPWEYITTCRYVDKKNSRVKFLCYKHDLEFEISYDGFIGKNAGCYECGKERMIASKRKDTNTMKNEMIKIHGDKYTYDDFHYDETYDYHHTECVFGCTLHKDVKIHKTLANFRKTDREHCPVCNESEGTMREPSTLYVQKITHPTKGVFYKLGVTNDINRRISQQKHYAHTEHDVLLIEDFETRREAQDLEQKIKGTITNKVVEKEDFPDGYTETFNEEDLDLVLSMIKEWKTK